jgi:amino acid transporter
LPLTQSAGLPSLAHSQGETAIFDVLVVASITFVAYEGFQLIINAVNEMEKPEIKIPRATYSAIFLAILIYLVISLGAILAIPFEDIINNKEYALAAGANKVLGHWGNNLVIAGALLATSSAISGTVFGASRQMAVIAGDGYFPSLLARRKNHIPVYAILTMAALAFCLVLSGSLQVILEFGSITFLLVSLLMAYANYRIRDLTHSSVTITILSLFGLAAGTLLIFYYEISTQIRQMIFIGGIYVLLTTGSWLYSRGKIIQNGNRHIDDQS